MEIAPAPSQVPPHLDPMEIRRRAAMLSSESHHHVVRHQTGSTGNGSESNSIELYIEPPSSHSGEETPCCSRCCRRQGCARATCATLRNLRSRNVWKAFILGQLISLLLCSTSWIAQILVENYNVKLPAGQTMLHYILLCAFYMSLLGLGKSKSGDSLAVVFRRRGLRYMFFGLVDAEANYVTAKALQYTTLTGIQLLDCFSIPTVLILSWLFLKARYNLTHIGGLALSLMSVVTLVWIDVDDGKGGVAVGGRDRLIGDLLTLLGAFLNGISMVGLEHSTRFYDSAEFFGLVGLFGTLVTAIQLAVLERDAILSIKWELWEISVLMAALAVAQFVRLTCLPYMIRMCSTAGLNLSLLSTDFFSIMAGVIFFQYKFRELYLVSLALVLVGFLIFMLQPVPWGKRSKSMDGSNGSGSMYAGGCPDQTSCHSSQSTLFHHPKSPVIPLSALQDINFCSQTPCSVQPTTLPTIEIHTMGSSSIPETCNGGLRNFSNNVM